jgi:hypothetical protein
MDDHTVPCTYFGKRGKDNTPRVLEMAKARAEELGIQSVVVATTTGYTGALASQVFAGYNLIAVTHSTGFKEPNYQELSEENRKTIKANGGKILTSQHGFGGVGRAVRKKLGTYELEEIVAYTLRTFGEGMKVVCEVSLMAADAGLIAVGQPVIAIAGTGRGADTAVVLRATNAQSFFDMRVMEVLCKPGFYSTDE